MSCLGDVAAALVDGELGHAARERALRHLADCPACRAEVQAQRRLKGTLGRGPQPAPPTDFTARLLAVSTSPATGAGQAPTGRGGGSGPRPVRPARRARRRVAASGAFALAVGTATVLALGSPPPRGPQPPVDPGSDAFVVDFQRSASDGLVVSNAGVTRPFDAAAGR